MRKLLLLGMLLILFVPVISCEETEEGADSECDVIVRNYTDDDLWIEIDGVARGKVDNDGIGITVWDDIDEGFHTLIAFEDPAYTIQHCQVITGYLDDAEDFHWYLQDGHEYSGTDTGDCN